MKKFQTWLEMALHAAELKLDCVEFYTTEGCSVYVLTRRLLDYPMSHRRRVLSVYFGRGDQRQQVEVEDMGCWV